MCNTTKAIFLTFIFILSFSSQGSEDPKLFDGFWKNTKDSFSNDKAYYHLAGIALTPILIHTGADAEVNSAFSNKVPREPYLPGVVGGYVAPLLLGVPLYIHGRNTSNNESIGAAYAVAHTTIITAAYVGFLKGLTGREHQDNDSSKSLREQSKQFNFGIIKKSVLKGWPSGHLATTTALMSTLTHYYPEKLWLQWAGYSATAYMAVTVLAHQGGEMHWFSDAVAGALMGYAIGSTVGSNFRERMKGTENPAERYTVLPLIGPTQSGVQVVWNY